jgi:DNA polymerase-4
VTSRINTKSGLNKVYFGGMQDAHAHDTAPMRRCAPFQPHPESRQSEANQKAPWLEEMNRFKAITEGEHRRREKDKRSR